MSWLGLVGAALLGAVTWRLLSDYGFRPGDPVGENPRALALAAAVGVGFAGAVGGAGWGLEALFVAGLYLLCRIVWFAGHERRLR